MNANTLTDAERELVEKFWNSTDSVLTRLRDVVDTDDDRYRAIGFILQYDETARMSISGPSAEDALAGEVA